MLEGADTFPGTHSKNATVLERIILLLLISNILKEGGYKLYPKKIPGDVLLSNFFLSW